MLLCIGHRLRPWLGAALLGAYLIAGGPALGPQQALAAQNVINGTTNSNQCGNVLGCPQVSGDVTDGTLTIINTGEMIGGAQAYGGYTLDGRAYGNAFIMNGGSIVGGNGYGGYTANGTADGNRVTITDTGGDGNGGRVESTSGSGGNLYGGYSESGGNALNNVVTINNGNIYGSVFGGRVSSGLANGNEVSVSANGLVQTAVYGGRVEGTGQAANNKVTVSGLAYTGAYGAYVNEGDALHNEVTISGGKVINGWVYGGRVENQGNAIGNRVTIIKAASEIGRQIYGGYAADGQALQNVVMFEDGIARGQIFGGYSVSGDARLNRVTISGGTVYNHVYGGYSEQRAATGNQVTISGGTVDNNVYGGYSEQGTATGNTVVLGDALITGSVLGGWSQDLSMDVRTGNRLSVNGFKGSLVQLDNFEFYDFYIPDSLNNNGTLINITGTPTDLTGSRVTSITFDPNSSLTDGHQVTLIDGVSGTFDTAAIHAPQSALVLHKVSVEKDADKLIARLNGNMANPQTKALAQGAMAGMVLLNQGADLAFSQGLDSALNSVMTTESGRPAFFMTTSAATSRVTTGSHINLDGWSLLAGLAWKADHTDRQGWLAGAYLETGLGSYNSYNSFAGFSQVHSSGDTKYYGVGVISRYQWASGFRAEAGLRAGRVETTYQGSGYLGGSRVEFDLDTAYYGAYLGLGHEMPLSKSLTLDLAARYIWTHENGQKRRVVGDRLEFDDVNSHRLRAGGQLTFEVDPVLVPYAGVWVEQEFDGQAGSRNLTAQFTHDSLKTQGTTGGGELGLKIKPGRSDHVNLDLGLQGYTGRREGVSGHISLTVAF